MVVQQWHVKDCSGCSATSRKGWSGCSAMACERLEWLFSNIMGKAGVVVQQWHVKDWRGCSAMACERL